MLVNPERKAEKKITEINLLEYIRHFMPNQMSMQFLNGFEFQRATLYESFGDIVRMRIVILGIG